MMVMATGRGEAVSEVRRTAQGCAGLMSTFRAEGGEPTAMDKERMYVVLARLVVWQYPEVASRPALNCHCHQHVILGHERSGTAYIQDAFFVDTCLSSHTTVTSLRRGQHPPPASPAPSFLASFLLNTCIPETGFGLSASFNKACNGLSCR